LRFAQISNSSINQTCLIFVSALNRFLVVFVSVQINWFLTSTADWQHIVALGKAIAWYNQRSERVS